MDPPGRSHPASDFPLQLAGRCSAMERSAAPLLNVDAPVVGGAGPAAFAFWLDRAWVLRAVAQTLVIAPHPAGGAAAEQTLALPDPAMALAWCPVDASVSPTAHCEASGAFVVATCTGVVLFAPTGLSPEPVWAPLWTSKPFVMPDVTCLACSPGGEFCMVGRKSGLVIWSTHMDDPLWSASPETCPGGVHVASFSQDGRLFATASRDQPVARVWWRRLASQAGFGVRMLSHPAPVTALEWRPRKTWSQTLLVSTASGEAVVWQESGRGEDFAFYMMARLSHTPYSAFSWLQYHIDYQGLLWPTASPVRRKSATRSPWGSMERGHDHGDAFGHDVFEDFESRAGPFPNRTCCVDWICSVDVQNRATRVWSMEGLGEWARRSATVALALRVDLPRGSHLASFSAVAASSSLSDPQSSPAEISNCTKSCFAWCQVPVPAAGSSALLPSFDQLYADNSPFTWSALCVSAEQQQQQQLWHVHHGDAGAVFSPVPHALGGFVRRVCVDEDVVITLSTSGLLQARKHDGLEILGRAIALPDALEVVIVDREAVAVLESNDVVRVIRLTPQGLVDPLTAAASSSSPKLRSLARSLSADSVYSAPPSSPRTGAGSEDAVVAFVRVGTAVAIIRRQGVTVVDPLRPRLQVDVANVTCATSAGDAAILLGTTNGHVQRFDVRTGAVDAFPMPSLAAAASEASEKQQLIRLISVSPSRAVAVVAGHLSHTVHLVVGESASSVSLESAVECLSWLQIAPGVDLLACGLLSGVCCVVARKDWQDWTVLATSPVDLSPASQICLLPDARVLRLTRQRVLSVLSAWVGQGASTTRLVKKCPLPFALPHLGCLAVAGLGGLSLPPYHPRVLFELMRLNEHKVVGHILDELCTALSDFADANDSGGKGGCPVPWVYGTITTSATTSAADEVNALNSSNGQTVQARIETLLSTVGVAGLAPKDHLRLLAMSDAHAKVTRGAKQGLDDSGSHFSLALQLFFAQRTMLGPDDRPRALQTSDVAWAVLSEAPQSLLKLAVGEQPTWTDARMVGIGLWLRDVELCKQLAEKMARAQYLQGGTKDPFRCLLFYAALNKCKVVAALFRATKVNDKLADLLAQDFTVDRWRQAASKNAFALLAKQRYEEAVAFFIMAGKTFDACRVCVRNMGDWQLALFLARILEGETSEAHKDVVEHTLVMVAKALGDRWLLSIAAMLSKDGNASVLAFAGEPPSFSGSKEELEYYQSLSTCLLPTRYDACEPAFLRQVLKQAPFWGRSTAHDGLVTASSERASLFFVQQGMPWVAMALGGDDWVRTNATVVMCTILALEGASNFNRNTEAAATAGEIVMRGIADLSKRARLDLDRILNHVDAILVTLQQPTALCCVDSTAGMEALVSGVSRAAWFMQSPSQLQQGGRSKWLVCLSDGLRRWGGKSLYFELAHTAMTLAYLAANRYEGVKETLQALQVVAAAGAAASTTTTQETPATSFASVAGQWWEAPPLESKEWPAVFARKVLGLMVIERLVASAPALAAGLRKAALADVHSTRGGESNEAIMEASRRMMSGRGLPPPEQDLWVMLGGADRLQKFAGEVASGVSQLKGSGGGAFAAGGKATKFSSVTLYSRPGDLLLGVGVSRARPEFLIVAGDMGTRDINTDSSLRFRERTPDGRGLLDADLDTWLGVLSRFRAKEQHQEQQQQPTRAGEPPGRLVANNRQRTTSAAGSPHHRVSTAGRAFAAAMASAPALGDKLGHGEVASSVDCHTVVPLYCAGTNDGTVLVYDIAEPFALAKLCKPGNAGWRSTGFSTKVKISPDGLKVLGADSAGQVAFWNLDGGYVQAFAGVSCHHAAAKDACFLNSSTLFASCSTAEQDVQVWDLLLPPHSRKVMTFRIPGGDLGVHSLAFSGPRVFAGSGEGGLFAFDLRKRAYSHSVVGAHAKAVVCMDISPSGVLATGSADGTVKLWGIDGGSLSAGVVIAGSGGRSLHQPALAFNSASSTSLISVNGVTSMAFFGADLYSVGADGTAKVTNTQVGGVY